MKGMHLQKGLITIIDGRSKNRLEPLTPTVKGFSPYPQGTMTHRNSVKMNVNSTVRRDLYSHQLSN